MKRTMNKIAAYAACFALACTVTSLQAAEKGHGHDNDHDHEEAMAGPNGGKVITSVEPHLEFFVTKDRKVQITALGEDLKPIALEEQSIRVIGGSRSNPTRLSFAKQGQSLISDKAFPAGNDFPVVVQIKSSANAKTIMEKFNLNLSKCPTCEYKEYACTCDHGGHDGHDDHDDHDDHDHDDHGHKGHKH